MITKQFKYNSFLADFYFQTLVYQNQNSSLILSPDENLNTSSIKFELSSR